MFAQAPWTPPLHGVPSQSSRSAPGWRPPAQVIPRLRHLTKGICGGFLEIPEIKKYYKKLAAKREVNISELKKQVDIFIWLYLCLQAPWSSLMHGAFESVGALCARAAAAS